MLYNKMFHLTKFQVKRLLIWYELCSMDYEDNPNLLCFIF